MKRIRNRRPGPRTVSRGRSRCTILLALVCCSSACSSSESVVTGSSLVEAVPGYVAFKGLAPGASAEARIALRVEQDPTVFVRRIRIDGDPAYNRSPTVEARPPGSTETLAEPTVAHPSITLTTLTPLGDPFVFRVAATDAFGLTGFCDTTISVGTR